MSPGTAAVLNGMLAASRARRFQNWPEVIEHLTHAHTELTGRSVPLTSAPQSQRPSPSASVPPSRQAPVSRPGRIRPSSASSGARLGFWLAIVLLAAIGAAVIFFGWRLLFAP